MTLTDAQTEQLQTNVEAPWPIQAGPDPAGSALTEVVQNAAGALVNDAFSVSIYG